jgi:hypothetical protein
MQFDLGSWDFFPAEDFNTAAPRAAGPLNAELLVQVRPNGRMLAHFRLGLGGSSVLDAWFLMDNLLAFPTAKDWTAIYQIWPRYVNLRRNMATTG